MGGAVNRGHPGGGSGRRVVAAGFLLHLLLGVAYAYGVVRPWFKAEFGLDDAHAAWPYSAILAGYTAGMVAGGWLVDRRDPRAVAAAGVALYGLGFLAAARADGLAPLMLAYGGLAGLGMGLAYMAAVGAAVGWYPARRGAATGAVVLGFGLSSVALAPALHHLEAVGGWRWAFGVLGVVFVAAGLPLAAALRPAPSPAEAADGTEPALGGRREFWTLWAGWAVALSVGLAWLGLLPALQVARGMAVGAAAALVGAVAVANGVGRPAWGAVADRWGRVPVLVAASLVGAAALAGLAAFPSPAAGWILAPLVGAAFAGWLVNMAPIAAERFGGRGLGGPYGRLFTAYGFGALAGPPAIGAARAAGAGDAAVLWASSGALLAAAALFHAARPQKDETPGAAGAS